MKSARNRKVKMVGNGLMARTSPPSGTPPVPEGRWLRIGDAVAYSGLSRSALKRYEKRWLLDCYRTAGGHRRYAQHDLDAFINRRRP